MHSGLAGARSASNEWLWRRRGSRAARLAFALLATANASARERRWRPVRVEGDTLVRSRSDGVIVTVPDYFYLPEQRVLDQYCHLRTPRVGETVIDVGAGLGDTTRVFSSLVGPAGRVISVEAHPGAFGCLTRMVELGSMTNVEPLHAAIAAEAGPVSISDDDNWKGNRTAEPRRAGAIDVAGVTLDQLCQELGVREVALLAMNIEGGEGPATRGMSASIDRCDSVAICSHDFKADETGDETFRTKADVSDFLRSHGFRVTTRAGDPSPWIRDVVYGVRP